MATPAPAAVDAYVCTTCGAPLTFDPATTSLTCDHCGATQPIQLAEGAVPTHDLFGKTAIASLHASQVAAGARTITCKQCGAQAIVTRRAERCAFCDAPIVVDVDQGSAAIPPGGVIPFAIGSGDATRRFADWLAHRWFAPRDLVARARRDRLDGVYLPYWAFDAASTTQYDGQRGTVRMTSETSTDANGQEQTSTVETVDWFPVSGTVTASTKDVLVIASPTLGHKLVARLAPWDLPSLRVFDPRFLAGFTAECYQVQPADGFTAAYPSIEFDIKARICAAIGGDRQRIDGMNVQWDAVGFRNLLLPVWLSAFRYRGKVYHVAVNAKTGEVVGERPYSVGKIALFALGVAALIATIVLLVLCE